MSRTELVRLSGISKQHLALKLRDLQVLRLHQILAGNACCGSSASAFHPTAHCD